MIHIQNLPRTKLNAATYNPRRITGEEFRGLKNSIAQFGIVDPVIVNKDYTIIGGHQRVQAAAELNIDEIPCVMLDLPPEKEKMLNVLLNSQAISGSNDDEKLSELLLEIKEATGDEDYQALRLDVLEPVGYGSGGEDEDQTAGKLKVARIMITFNDPMLREDALAYLIDMDFADKYDCQIKAKE